MPSPSLATADVDVHRPSQGGAESVHIGKRFETVRHLAGLPATWFSPFTIRSRHVALEHVVRAEPRLEVSGAESLGLGSFSAHRPKLEWS